MPQSKIEAQKVRIQKIRMAALVRDTRGHSNKILRA